MANSKKLNDLTGGKQIEAAVPKGAASGGRYAAPLMASLDSGH
ncbi:hypothetical protein [Streptomyces althioticus]